jgi:putative tricarboxylic transport membrane protein
MLLVFGRVAIRWLRNIGMVPNGLLLPSVVVLCFAGSFSVSSSYFDMILTLIGGIVGVIMRKMSVPTAPLIISLLLAPSLEQNIRQSLAFSDGSFAIFVTRPISAALLALTVISIVGFAWSHMRKAKTTEA